MALPTKRVLDLEALTLEELVAVVRTLDEAGRDGPDLTEARRLLSNGVVINPRPLDLDALEAAYDAVSDFYFETAGVR